MISTPVRSDAPTWPDEQLAKLFGEGFPPFITADRLVKQYIGRVREYFAGLDLMPLDADGVPVAAGWAVPLRWNGRADALVRAVEGHEQGLEPDTLVICGAIVTPSLKGQGVAGRMLTALREAGQDAGPARAIAPVRPTTEAAVR